MRTLEIRRHSHRKAGGGSQLSQAGVEHARALGARIGPFDYVVASVAPRARETAIAMGYAVDQEMVTLATDEDFYAEMEASGWWKEPYPFAALAALVAQNGAVWRFGSALVALLRDFLTPLNDGASALVITHSGDLELMLVCCFPGADHAAWGGGFEPCEGARLTFDGALLRFTNIEFLRGGA